MCKHSKDGKCTICLVAEGAPWGPVHEKECDGKNEECEFYSFVKEHYDDSTT